MGGKFHLKLNTDERPIANKYREGKMKRTLKRELKELEIVWRATVFEQCTAYGAIIVVYNRKRIVQSVVCVGFFWNTALGER